MVQFNNVCDTFYFRQFLEEPQNRNPKKTDMEVYQDSENAMFPYESVCVFAARQKLRLSRIRQNIKNILTKL